MTCSFILIFYSVNKNHVLFSNFEYRIRFEYIFKKEFKITITKHENPKFLYNSILYYIIIRIKNQVKRYTNRHKSRLLIYIIL